MEEQAMVPNPLRVSKAILLHLLRNVLFRSSHALFPYFAKKMQSPRVAR